MGKDKLKSIIFTVIFIVGIIVLMNSVKLGESTMLNFNKRYGTPSMSQYLIYLDQFMANYKFLGGILSLVGGLGLVLSLNNDK